MYVKCCSRHVTSNVPSAIVDSRVEKSKKCMLDKFARPKRHILSILRGDPKFHMIEESNVLEERPFLGNGSTQTLAMPAVSCIIMRRVVICRQCLYSPFDIKPFLWYFLVRFSFAEKKFKKIIIVQILFAVGSAWKFSRYSNLH